MTGHTIWTLQVAVVLPEGMDPIDLPLLVALEDRVRTAIGSVTDTVHVDTFTVRPGDVHTSLASVLDGHRAQPDGTCGCGWVPGVESHGEHVANVFEESARAHVAA